MGIATKKTIELEVDADLLRRAQDAGLDLSPVLERAIERRLPPMSPEERARWQGENREAIESSNRYVEEHGLPLARYRMF